MVPLFASQDLFYFDGSGHSAGIVLSKLANDKQAVTSLGLDDFDSIPVDYYSLKLRQEKRIGKFNVLSGNTSTYYYRKFHSYITTLGCGYDLDNNRQITMNEIVGYLGFTRLPPIFDIGKEELYDWNNERKNILSGTIPNFLQQDEYDKNYEASNNSLGFAVVSNLSIECPPPPQSESAIAAQEAVNLALKSSISIKRTNGIIADTRKLMRKGGDGLYKISDMLVNKAADSNNPLAKMIYGQASLYTAGAGMAVNAAESAGGEVAEAVRNVGSSILFGEQHTELLGDQLGEQAKQAKKIFLDNPIEHWKKSESFKNLPQDAVDTVTGTVKAAVDKCKKDPRGCGEFGIALVAGAGVENAASKVLRKVLKIKPKGLTSKEISICM